jgi:hypothetical protein
VNPTGISTGLAKIGNSLGLQKANWSDRAIYGGEADGLCTMGKITHVDSVGF